MTDLPRAIKAHPLTLGGPHSAGCTLDYEGRFVRRKRLMTDEGWPFVVDLAQTTSMDNGSHFELDDGRTVMVHAAIEPLLQIKGDLPRLAWHIGNRHTPCQMAGDHLLIQRDPVIAHMLEHLNADVTEVMRRFCPEGGAYGHGRTLPHDHGHGAHDHGHSHAHPHEH